MTVDEWIATAMVRNDKEIGYPCKNKKIPRCEERKRSCDTLTTSGVSEEFRREQGCLLGYTERRKKIPRCEERRRKGEKRNATGKTVKTNLKNIFQICFIARFLNYSTKKVKRFFFWQLFKQEKIKKLFVKSNR